MSAKQAGRTARPLRTELLLHLAALVLVSELILVAGIVLCDAAIWSRCGAASLGGLIVLDLVVVTGLGTFSLRRRILRPLTEAVAATEAIAAGDLGHRMPAGGSAEFARLAAGLNRLTTRVVDGHTRLVRSEKMAGVGRLAAGVAHEIGNPLGAINGYAHILRKRLAGQAELAEAAIGIERESERIDRIVRGLLDYARPRRTAAESIDLNASVRCVADLLRVQGALHQTDLELRLHAETLTLWGDRHELDQVFVNLMLNAVDAIGGGGKIAITTSRLPLASLMSDERRRATDSFSTAVARTPSARARAWLNSIGETREVFQVVVADSGPGIPDVDAERIFDPFYTTKAPGKGTGLGLAIVARSVEALGGVVYVRQAREGGAAFVLLFPASPSTPLTSALAPSRLPPGP